MVRAFTIKAVVAILLLLLFGGVPTVQGQPKLLAAPDIVPPATEEMQHPDFWISRLDGDPDRVIMTPEQIEALMAKNRTRPLERKDVNGNAVAVESELQGGNFMGITFHLEDPLSVDSYSGPEIRARLGRSIDFFSDGDFWDRRRIPYPAWKKRELAGMINADTVPDTVTPRRGIIVRHTLNRNVPTNDRVYRGQQHWLDMFMNAVLETGTPVSILHASRDGSWLYVRSEYSHGWVPAANVAEGSIRDIRRLAEPRDFIVAIAHKVPVYADRECSRWLSDIYMGARLGLKGKSDAGYRVTVPFRMHDGALAAVDGWIRPDASVSVGFQHYTRRNVIETVFRLLGRPYGWGGTDHERDCVGTVRAVYRTFGINMPRWTTYELACTDHVVTFPADTPKEVKYRYLDACEPGITVCGFDWHVTLYLGKVDGVHYVIHQNGFSYHDDDGNELRVARVSVNHTELEGGADIGRWTDLAEFRP